MMGDPNWVLENDPKRPYKMYAAIAAAFITSLIGSNILGVYGTAVATAIVAAIAVYLTPSPLRVKKKSPSPAYDEGDPSLF